jgi:hypothetical protein
MRTAPHPGAYRGGARRDPEIEFSRFDLQRRGQRGRALHISEIPKIIQELTQCERH